MYYGFFDLINKYSCTFKAIIKGNGAYDETGEYKSTVEEEKELQGAIIGISDSKRYNSNGTLTDRDKYLFMLEELPICDIDIIYRDKRYSVDNQVESAEFTGVYQYTLKYVSSFGEVQS
jgi:hypothetical protein